jgi:hypothetical protein
MLSKSRLSKSLAPLSENSGRSNKLGINLAKDAACTAKFDIERPPFTTTGWTL